jgi:signal transduction histidine kinase
VRRQLSAMAGSKREGVEPECAQGSHAGNAGSEEWNQMSGGRRGKTAAGLGETMGQLGDVEMAGRQRVEAMVQTLASLGSRGESLAEVAHDARNMVTALGLYCDLLEEPGVLAVPFAHYGSELRLVAGASRRLVEKLVALDSHLDAQAGREPGALDLQAAGFAVDGSGPGGPGPGERQGSSSAEALQGLRAEAIGSIEHSSGSGAGPISGLGSGLAPERGSRPGADRARHWETMFSEPVGNLAAELLANRNLLSALAGPGIMVTVDAEGGARPVRLTAEDLTRLLVNLVKNAAEAIPIKLGRGHIQISLRERGPASGAPQVLLLAVEDNGPGIPLEVLGKVFDSGFSTHARNAVNSGGWPVAHRGLGLAISRSIVESSGGRVAASNRAQGGARIEIELPVRVT